MVARSAQRPRCLYPGCTRPARLGEGRGAPPKYHGIDGHGPHSAHRERQRLLAAGQRLDADSDPALLLAEIATLHRESAALRAELEVERHHHRVHHPDCTCPDGDQRPE